jgi:hypothetical protein
MLGAWLGLAQPASAVQVTDVLGRTVTVEQTPQRIVLGEGRLFFALALLDRDNPSSGWSAGRTTCACSTRTPMRRTPSAIRRSASCR